MLFLNGLQKAPTDPVVKQKRWAETRGIQAVNAVYVTNPQSLDDPNVEEIGDFQSKEDKELRSLAEKEKPRIVWNVERNCYLSQMSYLW